MTTDPGDLVFDPTCGSGTTAYVAEQWGRRWITCDTSRVALALARQRLTAASFPYYQLDHPSQGVSGGFKYEEVPHVTLKSIAQGLQAETEKLFDRPLVEPGVVRVSGPFTVEAINVLDPGEALAFEPVERRARKDDISPRGDAGSSVSDHLAEMIDLLRRDGGISVPGKGRVEIQALGRLTERPGIHGEGTIRLDGKDRRVAVAFGPRYGPVTARLVEEAVQASVGSYEALVVAGFSFDPEVSAFLDKSPPAGLRFFRVQIAPDVLVGDLLKTRARENLFAVIGEPDFEVTKTKEKGQVVVRLNGVDIYDPNKNEVVPRSLAEIAAWFVDHDYDGRCFCVCQAFLPAEKGKAFEKLQRALKGIVDEEAWQAVSGFESRPFKPGEHRCVAVKVIDVRGHEVVGVRRLGA